MVGSAFSHPLAQHLRTDGAVLLAIRSDDLVHVLTFAGNAGLRQGSEPFPAFIDIGFYEIIVTFGQIYDSLDQADEVHYRRGNKTR